MTKKKTQEVKITLEQAVVIFMDGYEKGFKHKFVDINKYFEKQWGIDIKNKTQINVDKSSA